MTDYIDRNDLIDTLDNCIDVLEEMGCATQEQVYEKTGEMNATKAIRVFVKRFDAADVKPVVRGWWESSEEYKGYLTCSACHNCFVEREWLVNGKWSYCPSCGADMRYEIADGTSSRSKSDE